MRQRWPEPGGQLDVAAGVDELARPFGSEAGVAVVDAGQQVAVDVDHGVGAGCWGGNSTEGTLAAGSAASSAASSVASSRHRGISTTKAPVIT